jgi:hypothetical protein
MQPFPKPSLTRAIVACALAGTVAVVLSACGSSANTSSAASGTPVSNSTSAYQNRLKFAECMRAHGVNVPDPSANGGPAGGVAGGGGGGGGGGGAFRALRSSPNFAAASTACAKYRSKAFGFANITPAQRAQFQQEAVKFAECMRAHSVNIPDPSSNGAGGFGIFRTIPPSERQSPVFEAAIKACASVLPFRRGGAAGGGGPAGAGAPGA